LVLAFLLKENFFEKKEVYMTTAIVKRQNGSPSVSFGSVVDNIFQNSLRRFLDDNFWDTDASLTGGSVPINVRETNLQYEMDVIAPGCRKEDFAINVENNTLTISFAHKDEPKEQNEKAGWVRNEYVQQSFTRSFTLDETVDVNKITAAYKDGILQLILPKNEKAQKWVKNIEIK
jgi:HSP20 family protein